jgi:geranylgeranyl diphosphate synthase, type II
MTTPPHLIAFESFFAETLATHTLQIPSPLKESILYSAQGGGKRIRPHIVLSVGKSLGIPETILLRLAATVELVHTYTLVHDDLPCMDNDDFRRGKPTNHKVFGEATALLAGDALMALAIDVILDLETMKEPGSGRAIASQRAILNAIRLTSQAMGGKGVIAGQTTELTLPKNPKLSDLLDVFRQKTGDLFGLAFRLPALFIEKNDAEGDLQLKRIGETLGIAFQMADDLEDAIPESGHPALHIRAHLTDDETLQWVKTQEATLFNSLPESLKPIRTFTENLFQDISKKCELAKKIRN